VPNIGIRPPASSTLVVATARAESRGGARRVAALSGQIKPAPVRTIPKKAARCGVGG
jgi:hypothetical protein